MEDIIENAQSPVFPHRMASLRRWASKETIKATDIAKKSLKSRTAAEVTPTPSQIEKQHLQRREPLMRGRTDGKLMFPAWPALKSSSPRADRDATTSPMKSPEEQLSTMKPSANGLKSILPGTSWGARKMEATLSKRKASVSDVMTTVPEMSLDSPTIPDHLAGRPLHPGIERSLSVPGHALRPLSDELSDTTPRASEFPQFNDGIDTYSASKEIAPNETRKRPTLLMPKDLKPLIIPKVVGPEAFLEALKSDTFDGLSTIPPKVPPKSPRTESRASPRTQKTPHSSNSSVSSVRSAASSTSSHSVKDNWSPRPLQTRSRNGSPSSHLRGMEIVSRTPPLARSEVSPRRARNLNSTTSRPPAISRVSAGRSQSPSLPSAPVSRKPSRSPIRCGSEAEVMASDSVCHEQERCDPLFYNQVRGASMRRGDTTSIHDLIRTIANGSTQYKGTFDLPSGLRAIDATSNVPEAEAKALRTQRGRHVEKSELLQAKNVFMLSQELELLDERCEYLQSTHKLLRQGRRNLHTRMITYLRSPRMAKVSRESILKQEEALAELDISIDDWVAKLEAAEERRITIRQKLLEHVAAALTLQTIVMPRQAYFDEATPPVSPEKEDDYLSSARKDVQSIRIYAGEGVATLLAEIEKEIDYISEPGKPG